MAAGERFRNLKLSTLAFLTSSECGDRRRGSPVGHWARVTACFDDFNATFGIVAEPADCRLGENKDATDPQFAYSGGLIAREIGDEVWRRAE